VSASQTQTHCQIISFSILFILRWNTKRVSSAISGLIHWVITTTITFEDRKSQQLPAAEHNIPSK